MDARARDDLRRFAEYLRSERRLAELTRTHYLRDLESFAGFCADRGIGDWSDVDANSVRQFAAERHRRGLGGRSIQRMLSAVRGFFRFLIRDGRVAFNPAADVRAPKAPRRLPKTLDPDETGRLLEGGDDNPLLVRDRALFELIYSSGLRLAEAVSLDLDAVDRREQSLRITGKGAKTRVVPVGRQALQALDAWLALRPGIAAGNETALFVSRNGRRLSPRSIQDRLKGLATRQGLGRPVNPHMLRHAFASHLLESSGDLRAVQELLGHADIATTQVYTHLDFQHLADVYDNAHPRARKRSEEE
ncbi:tyrosine recombinase XerC [Ectothiorhodospiraceae bacterium WFHF3C12]|nr:tyrosine recombinase XerC [Ectothiorhodospiraceae bacterium WFHF3C12]